MHHFQLCVSLGSVSSWLPSRCVKTQSVEEDTACSRRRSGLAGPHSPKAQTASHSQGLLGEAWRGGGLRWRIHIVIAVNRKWCKLWWCILWPPTYQSSWLRWDSFRWVSLLYWRSGRAIGSLSLPLSSKFYSSRSLHSLSLVLSFSLFFSLFLKQT